MLHFFRAALPAIFLFICCACNQAGPPPTVSKEGKDTFAIPPVKDISSPPVPNYMQLDVSPMDMIYFPVDYPKQKMAHTTGIPPVVRVIYSRPHRQGRKIFGEHLQYGEYWRLGANEATEIQLYRDILIQDKKVPKGRYVLYCVPYENKWTIVFSSNIDSWGLSKDKTDDLFRFDIPVAYNPQNLVEYFTMAFVPADKGCELIMAWENMQGRLLFTL